MLAYYVGIRLRCRGSVTLGCIRATLHSILPWARVVGDKYPGHVFDLDRLAALPELRCIVIYRDCRDVVNSCLEKVRTAWKSRPFAKRFDAPGKVATRWVRAIDQQERNAPRILAIRYEDLVTDPGPVLMRVGEYLGIDPAGFRPGILRPTSIGKHKNRLSAQALKEIEDIAGETMKRLGYL